MVTVLNRLVFTFDFIDLLLFDLYFTSINQFSNEQQSVSLLYLIGSLIECLDYSILYKHNYYLILYLFFTLIIYYLNKSICSTEYHEILVIKEFSNRLIQVCDKLDSRSQPKNLANLFYQ